MPLLVRGNSLEQPVGKKVVEEGGMLHSIAPVRTWSISLQHESAHDALRGLVPSFRNTVLLRRFRVGEGVDETELLKEGFEDLA